MPLPDPNANDWSDNDLLSIEEADERLVAEIAVVEGELQALRSDSVPRAAAVELAERRLRALAASRKRLAAAAGRA